MTNENSQLYVFLCGVIVAICWVIAVFFLKFWITSKDRLFAILSASFVVLGIERIVLVFFDSGTEGLPLTYFARLVAFGLIIFAVVDRNRSMKK